MNPDTNIILLKGSSIRPTNTLESNMILDEDLVDIEDPSVEQKHGHYPGTHLEYEDNTQVNDVDDNYEENNHNEDNYTDYDGNNYDANNYQNNYDENNYESNYDENNYDGSYDENNYEVNYDENNYESNYDENNYDGSYDDNYEDNDDNNYDENNYDDNYEGNNDGNYDVNNNEDNSDGDHDENNYDENHDENHNDNINAPISTGSSTVSVASTNEESVRPRRIPKSILANQQKFLEALERQKRMQTKKDKNSKNSRNGKNAKNSKNDKKSKTNKKSTNNQVTSYNDSSAMAKRRVIVAGKVKYIPVKETAVDSTVTSTDMDLGVTSTDMDLGVASTNTIGSKSNLKSGVKSNSKSNSKSNDNDPTILMNSRKTSGTTPEATEHISSRVTNQSKSTTKDPDNLTETLTYVNSSVANTNNNTLTDANAETAMEKKLPSGLAKKMNIFNTMQAKLNANNANKNKFAKGSGSNKKIPKKYAERIENAIRNQTIKNVKNFAELRKVKAMQDITTDPGIDLTKASIMELKRLKAEQRRKENLDNKKRDEGKKESVIQEILSNDKMSKFSKMVAIKNLQVNSRNRRNPVNKLQRMEINSG